MALARWQATITDRRGNIIPNATVEVRRETTGGLAALFSDRDGLTPSGNPVTADSQGYVYFHASGGAYRLTAYDAVGATLRVWRYVALGTAQEIDFEALPGLLFAWDEDNADSDQGIGRIWSNNDDLASATIIYISKTTRAGDDIAAFLASLDDAAGAVKGDLILTSTSGNAQAVFQVTSVTDATGYVRVTVQNPSGATGFFEGDVVGLLFTRAGDDGADGDVVGPGSSVDGEIALFDGTGGNALKGGLTLDTDEDLAADADDRVASQKAVKAYVDANAGGGSAGLAIAMAIVFSG